MISQAPLNSIQTATWGSVKLRVANITVWCEDWLGIERSSKLGWWIYSLAEYTCDVYKNISLCIKSIMTFFIMCYAIKSIEGVIVFDVQQGKRTSISAFRRPSLIASDRELLETSMITRAPPIWNPTMFIAKPSCNSNVRSPWIIHQKEEVKWNWKFDFFYIVSWEKRKKLLATSRHKEDQLQWIKLQCNHCYWN